MNATNERRVGLFKCFFFTKVDEIHDFVETVRGKGIDVLFSASAEPSSQESAFVRHFSNALATPMGQDIEHRFAILGKHVRLSSLAMKDTWIDLANGDATINKVFAVVLGYLIVGLVVALYLNVMNVGSMQSAGRAVRNAIRQQLIVVKVRMIWTI
jgi:E3 ubiquitin-protein ligase MARCH6